LPLLQVTLYHVLARMGYVHGYYMRLKDKLAVNIYPRHLPAQRIQPFYDSYEYVASEWTLGSLKLDQLKRHMQKGKASILLEINHAI